MLNPHGLDLEDMQLLCNQRIEHTTGSHFTSFRVSCAFTPPEPAQAPPVAPTPLVSPQPQLLNILKGDRGTNHHRRKTLISGGPRRHLS